MEKPLENSWKFYYLDSNEERPEGADYQTLIHEFAEAKSVGEFWSVYSHILRPSELKEGGELQMFKDGYMALWDGDRPNKACGKWFIVLDKDVTDTIWEHSLLSLIGGLLNKDIVGIVIKQRSIHILSFWVTNPSNAIPENIASVLNLPVHTEFVFKNLEKSTGNKKYIIGLKKQNKDFKDQRNPNRKPYKKFDPVRN